MPNMKNRKRESNATPLSGGMDAIIDFTIILIPGIDDRVRRGRSTRKVLKADRFETPGTRDRYPSATTTKSNQFQPFLR
jgi:hypothetical protein